MASSINASTSGAGGVITTADNTGILNLQTAGTNAITVDASQNVGIGTTSPSGKLDVTGTVYGGKNGTQGYIGIQGSGDTAHTGYIEFLAPNGTRRGYLGYADVSGSGQFNLWGESSTNALAFGTNSTERMRIDSSGNVLVNKTSQSNTGKLEIDYSRATHAGSNYNETSSASSCTHIAFQRGGTSVGSIQSGNNSSTSYNTSSDYRLKDNIVPMSGALDKISQLNPVNWTWKVDGTNGQGFIAHELQAIIPDCVTGEKDAVDEEGNPVYQGVDTSFLVATLTAAIQEQQTIINDLKARIETLEAK